MLVFYKLEEPNKTYYQLDDKLAMHTDGKIEKTRNKLDSEHPKMVPTSLSKNLGL